MLGMFLNYFLMEKIKDLMNGKIKYLIGVFIPK